MSRQIVSLDEDELRSQLGDLVRRTVEDTLNALLEEEADALVGAARYERSPERGAYRAGHYERGLTTTSGQVTLEVPKLKGARFASAVIERYRRREASVEEAIVEMYLAGVSTRRVEDVADLLWDASVSPATVSNLNERAFARIEEWRTRELGSWYPYVFVDGIYLKRSWGGSYENVAVMVAIGVDSEGDRDVIGCAEGFTESSECWEEFLHSLRQRGVEEVGLIVGDKEQAMVGAAARVFPKAKYQRCTVHFYRNVLSKVPKGKRPHVAAQLKAIHAMEDRDAAMRKAEEVADELTAQRLKSAARCVRKGVAETLAYMDFPHEHWRRIRTNNAIERLNREIRRRTNVVGTFPDGHAALMLVCARLKYIVDREWGKRRYLDTSLLDGPGLGDEADRTHRESAQDS